MGGDKLVSKLREDTRLPLIPSPNLQIQRNEYGGYFTRSLTHRVLYNILFDLSILNPLSLGFRQ